MPTVPNNVLPFASGPKPTGKIDDTYLMMAAADLHEAGRLFEPFTGIGTLEENGIKPVNPNSLEEVPQSEAERAQTRKNNNYPDLMNRSRANQKVPTS